MQSPTLDANYWNNRYETEQIGWDLGKVSPPIQKYMEQYPNKNAAILIPGCGNSYEAAFLLENGFTNVTIIDIAPLLTAHLQEKYKQNPYIRIILGDFFLHESQYDLILEQTFFCALSPELRLQYVAKMYDLLKSDGKLVGVLFSCMFDFAPPPFGGTKAEYTTIFSPYFTFKNFDTCYNSVRPRNGNELFITFVRK